MLNNLFREECKRLNVHIQFEHIILHIRTDNEVEAGQSVGTEAAEATQRHSDATKMDEGLCDQMAALCTVNQPLMR